MENHILTVAYLITINEFCQRYKVSRSLAYRLLSDGRLRAVKVGRLTRIRQEDADAWARGLGAFHSMSA
jgi:excisionase family DNA binding protein